MIEIRFKTTGGLAFDRDLIGDEGCIWLPEGARIMDLTGYIISHGIDLASPKYLVILNGRGLLQWPLEQPLQSGDLLLIIPPLMGG